MLFHLGQLLEGAKGAKEGNSSVMESVFFSLNSQSVLETNFPVKVQLENRRDFRCIMVSQNVCWISLACFQQGLWPSSFLKPSSSDLSLFVLTLKTQPES